jgi:hypothetical protein
MRMRVHVLIPLEKAWFPTMKDPVYPDWKGGGGGCPHEGRLVVGKRRRGTLTIGKRDRQQLYSRNSRGKEDQGGRGR